MLSFNNLKNTFGQLVYGHFMNSNNNDNKPARF